MSVYNLSKDHKRRMKSASRLYAVQALFQMEASSQPIDVVLKEFEDHRMGGEIDGAELEVGDINHFRRVVAGAVNNQARIDKMTDRALVAKWPIARIDPTLRALFRAAGAEMIERVNLTTIQTEMQVQSGVRAAILWQVMHGSPTYDIF
jgi:N utilization substance protein B